MKKPSITNLIKLLDKPALLKWANKKGLEGVDISVYSKDIMKTGTILHNQIQAYIEDGVAFEDANTQLCFESFISDKEVLCCEKEIETDYFVGRLDFMFKFKDSGRKILVDFKTTSQGANKKLYLENKLQLVAYGMAENSDGFAVVTLPDFSYIPLDITDRTPYEGIIKSLSNIYSLKKSIENGTTN